MSERVWWCKQHGSVFAEGSESDMCDGRILDQAIGFELTPCAMVKRLVVDPVSTLIVEKGEVEEVLAVTIGDAARAAFVNNDFTSLGIGRAVLDALKVAYDSQGDT